MTIPPRVLARAHSAQAPLYVYDLGVLRERLRLLEALPVPRKRIYFASMANDHPQVLAEIAAVGHGVFVNSLAHLTLARSAGVPAARIVFAASNMTRDEMTACLAAGVHIVLDSPGQVAMLDAIAPAGTAIGVRVNVGSATESPALSAEASYRFGLMPDELAQAVRSVANVRVVGVHSYFGTDIMAPPVLLDGLKRLAQVAETLPGLEYVDAGGGFGIPDESPGLPFDLALYGRGAAAIMTALEARLHRQVTLAIEPGRWLAGPIGWFFARIVDVKTRPDRIFAGLNASVAQFPRLLLYPEKARHPSEIVGAGDRPDAPRPVWLSGNSTYSRDFLARGIVLKMPREGDLVAFHHAGAYCRSMLTRFLGKEHPDEIVLGASARLAGGDLYSEAAE
jgi:diaminopimelate decarboxylase